MSINGLRLDLYHSVSVWIFDVVRRNPVIHFVKIFIACHLFLHIILHLHPYTFVRKHVVPGLIGEGDFSFILVLLR